MALLTISGSVVGFREGLEAFLMIGIMMRFLDKIGRSEFKKHVTAGLYAGIAGSVLFGLLLWGITALVGQYEAAVAQLWESGASLVALVMISTLLYWMMRHGKSIVGEIQSGVESNLSSLGLFVMATIMVLREGAEIALFAFVAPDSQTYLLGTAAGILAATVLAYLLNRSLVRVNLSAIFTITLAYLVLQAAYMLGYSVHELLSALRTLGYLSPGNPLFAQMYDLSGTVLDHKVGSIGIALNVLVGWYAKPERIQFFLQVGFIAGSFGIWHRLRQGSGVASVRVNSA